MLVAHVLNFHIGELTELEALSQRFIGCVGMHMHLDDLIVVHHHNTVSDGLQIGTQLEGIPAVLLVDDVLGAVGKRDLAFILAGGTQGRRIHWLAGNRRLAAFDDFAFGKYAAHPLKHERKALAACVHNAGFFQYRQHLGRLLQRLPGRTADLLPKRRKRTTLLRKPHRGLPGQARNGQHGALGGFHNGFIGGLHTLFQCGGHLPGVGGFQTRKTFGNAPEQQGQNHTRVSPCAPQEGRCGALRHSRNAARVALHRKFPCSRTNGHRHIGARIPVRHGKHIELIDLLPVIGE